MSIMDLIYTEEDYERARAYRELINELKDIRSLRKATVKLIDVKHIVSKYVKEDYIYVGSDSFRDFNYVAYCHLLVYSLPNEIELFCFICKCKIKGKLEIVTVANENNTKIEYQTCEDCKNKTICFGCLRESSRCKQIHTRKLLCYKFLLSQKFPKDIVRLIAKKVK